ncbi:hypothetical protein [Clostridium sp. B9]|uniref:hypothetical protein n=1 Tax=Clostridium sp. B9 TaxID=3423224 RepID=UPI003D2EB926
MNKFVIRRIVVFISSLFIIIFSLAFIGNKIYVREKCKDLYFATEYLSTKGNVENSFLTVHNFELSFLDGNLAVVEIKGLSYDEPHRSMTCNAYFERGGNSIWDLKEIVPLT